MGLLNHFLKSSNYLKTCSSSFFGALSVSLSTLNSLQFSSVQLLSRVQLFATPCTAACQASLSITNFPSLLKLISISDAIQPSHPLLSPSLPAFNLSQIKVFSNESVLHIRWPEYWTSASVSLLPKNIQDRFLLGLTSLISLLSKGLSRISSNTTVQKHQFFGAQLS